MGIQRMMQDLEKRGYVHDHTAPYSHTFVGGAQQDAQTLAVSRKRVVTFFHMNYHSRNDRALDGDARQIHAMIKSVFNLSPAIQ